MATGEVDRVGGFPSGITETSRKCDAREGPAGLEESTAADSTGVRIASLVV
jgi:hypothetical protein